MDSRSSARWHSAISFFCYVVCAPLMSHFVYPIGLGGLLGAYPLLTMTWLWGKKRGFVTAVVCVGLNSAIWFLVGNGKQTVSRSGAAFIAMMLFVECVAYSLLVLFASAMRRREDKIHGEIERAQCLLHYSEAKYRSLIEAAPEAISVVKNGRVIFCNSHLLQMLGYSHEEMIGMEIARVIHKDDLDWVLELYMARAEGKLFLRTVFRDVRKDGEVIWVESFGQWIEWEGMPAVLYFTSDVTERVRSEEALRDSEEKYRISESKYRNLIEVAPEAIFVVENEKVIFFNNHTLEMFGCAKDELMGKSIQALIYEEDWQQALERYRARSAGRLLKKSVSRYVKKSGEVIWAECVGQLILWETRPAVLYFSSDVTERKKIEEQFAQAQRMEAVGRLAGGVAHDFNNMIQVFLGYCSMMRGYPDDRNAILNDLQVLEDTGQRAASLTQQLLAFSRKQIVQPRIIEVGELVQQSEKMLSRVLGEDVSLSVFLGEEACRVRADAAQVQQVIMNLALNARDAMPEGGKIEISVDSVAMSEAIGSEIPPGKYVRLTVRDTGHGMDASIINRLFEPFFTTKGMGRGTGLGLSIVYGIVKQCGGYIQVNSKVGEGSMFTIHLPRVFEPTEDFSARAEGNSQHGSGSILLVEDEASVRGLVKKMLEKGGYTVTEADCGEEAIKICRAHEEGFDLLITDIVLTGMRGGEVSNRIAQMFPKIQVIYVSGYADKADEPQKEGAPIIQKPFSSIQLLTHVGKALSREMVV